MIKEIQYIHPLHLYNMIKDEPFSFILESSMFHEMYGRYSMVSSCPLHILEYKNDPSCINALRHEMSKYKKAYSDGLPFHGGAVGYLSYDVGKAFENIKISSQDDMNIPDLYFGLYDWLFLIDHKLQKAYIVTADIDEKREADIINQRVFQFNQYESDINNTDNIHSSVPTKPLLIQSNFSKEEYISSIEKVRQYIKKGDIYQANLTQRFEGITDRKAVDIYHELRTVSRTLFGGLLCFDKVQVISNSPERFLKIKDGKIETRPIKGTRPRGKTAEEDTRLKKELLSSVKDKAELLMIVDLERNDLGRISKVGSVKVPELFVIEEYANVHHLVATVTSEIAEDKDIFDVIEATFPGGSITGAPKIRAMEIIEELEPTARNVYTGSLGYIGFDGNMDLNIAIRTIVKKEDRITFQAGGGITWDSNPQEEYMETIHKASAIMKALNASLDEDKKGR